MGYKIGKNVKRLFAIRHGEPASQYGPAYDNSELYTNEDTVDALIRDMLPNTDPGEFLIKITFEVTKEEKIV